MSHYNTLVKFLSLNDTIHDFCNIGRNKSKIYKYDSDTFQHIILGLLKSDFDKIKNVEEFGIKKTYSNIYNTEIWNETISSVEDKIEKVIYNYLEKINFINKNTNKNYSFLNIGKLNTDKNTKIDIFDQIKKKTYYNIKNITNNHLSFILDANSIFHSKEFFCILPIVLEEEHYSIYNGLFSLYDAGSNYINTKNIKGGATKIGTIRLSLESNNNINNSSNNINNKILISKKCYEKDEKYEYSLKKEHNELIYVKEFGVIFNTDKNKFQLYRNINEDIQSLKLEENLNETLSLGSFVALLSLIENTIRKSTEQKENVTKYFKAITERTVLQSICDIYKIHLKIQKNKNVSSYARTVVTRLTQKQKDEKGDKEILEYLELKKKELQTKLNKLDYNNSVRNLINKLRINLKKQGISELKIENMQEQIELLISFTKNLVNEYETIDKQLKEFIVRESLEYYTKRFSSNNSNNSSNRKIMQEINSFVKVLTKLTIDYKNLIVETSYYDSVIKTLEILNEPKDYTSYCQLSPRDFCKCLIDFKRAMDYLQIKACKKFNEENKNKTGIFVSQDRPAILFSILNNCPTIKTIKDKDKNNILELYNFEKERGDIQSLINNSSNYSTNVNVNTLGSKIQNININAETSKEKYKEGYNAGFENAKSKDYNIISLKNITIPEDLNLKYESNYKDGYKEAYNERRAELKKYDVAYKKGYFDGSIKGNNVNQPYIDDIPEPENANINVEAYKEGFSDGYHESRMQYRNNSIEKLQESTEKTLEKEILTYHLSKFNSKLDNFIKSLTKKHPILGRDEKTIKKLIRDTINRINDKIKKETFNEVNRNTRINHKELFIKSLTEEIEKVNIKDKFLSKIQNEFELLYNNRQSGGKSTYIRNAYKPSLLKSDLETLSKTSLMSKTNLSLTPQTRKQINSELNKTRVKSKILQEVKTELNSSIKSSLLIPKNISTSSQKHLLTKSKLETTQKNIINDVFHNVNVEMLQILFNKEVLFSKFLKIYKDYFGKEMSVFMYMNYHTIFFLIDKKYNFDRTITSFTELYSKNIKSFIP